MNRWLEGQQNEWMDGCCCLTSRSSGLETVSLLCLLDRALGTVDGGSRNNLSSCNVFTLHWASPTNACASFAVIALEKPRPWDTAKHVYEREKPLSEWHFEQILTVTMIMLFSVITVLLTGSNVGSGWYSNGVSSVWRLSSCTYDLKNWDSLTAGDTNLIKVSFLNVDCSTNWENERLC